MILFLRGVRGVKNMLSHMLFFNCCFSFLGCKCVLHLSVANVFCNCVMAFVFAIVLQFCFAIAFAIVFYDCLLQVCVLRLGFAISFCNFLTQLCFAIAFCKCVLQLCFGCYIVATVFCYFVLWSYFAVVLCKCDLQTWFASALCKWRPSRWKAKPVFTADKPKKSWQTKNPRSPNSRKAEEGLTGDMRKKS